MRARRRERKRASDVIRESGWKRNSPHLENRTRDVVEVVIIRNFSQNFLNGNGILRTISNNALSPFTKYDYSFHERRLRERLDRLFPRKRKGIPRLCNCHFARETVAVSRRRIIVEKRRKDDGRPGKRRHHNRARSVVIAFQRERLNILSGPAIPARVDASR